MVQLLEQEAIYEQFALKLRCLPCLCSKGLSFFVKADKKSSINQAYFVE